MLLYFVPLITGSLCGKNAMSECNSAGIKKKAEEEALDYFLETYKRVTGQSLNVVENTERPDFICAREDGSKVGIELVKVRRSHPNNILWDRLIDKQEYMSIDAALKMLQEMAMVKDKKRNEPDWVHPDAAILLIVLTDISLTEIRNRITSKNLPDLYATGFVEVWLADFTGLEAYHNVELFCVQPTGWAGYCPRCFQKPYG
jgi:hypothetical protein